MKTPNHYELLQISPYADQDTVHRVYRYLAARYHPDNPDTGDVDMFTVLRGAYDVLSDPARRAEYDATCDRTPPEKPPLSNSVDFMDNVEGELNRRLAALAVLYFRRRAAPYNPEVSLADMEARMGFPREYLDFTTWYLEKKGYITRADNSDFTLTATGVDFVETQRANIPILNKLLTTGGQSTAQRPVPQNGHSATTSNHSGTYVVLPDMRRISERRANPKERRANSKDRRVNSADRRSNHSYLHA